MTWWQRKPKHVHDWTEWRMCDAEVTGMFMQPRAVQGQTRRCKECGWTQLERVGSTF